MSGAEVRLDRVVFSYGEARWRSTAGSRPAPSPRAWGRAAPANRRLLNLVAGFETPRSRTRADRRRRRDRRCRRAARPVSMVFQENNLFAHLDVAANVGLGRSPALRLTRGRSRRGRRRARAHRPRRQGSAPAARIVGRRAPTGGARARAGARPSGAAARRTLRLARSGAAPRHAGSGRATCMPSGG